MSRHCNRYPECGCPEDIGTKCNVIKKGRTVGPTIVTVGNPTMTAEELTKIMQELKERKEPVIVSLDGAEPVPFEQEPMILKVPERHYSFPKKSGQEKRRDRRKKQRRKR